MVQSQKDFLDFQSSPRLSFRITISLGTFLRKILFPLTLARLLSPTTSFQGLCLPPLANSQVCRSFSLMATCSLVRYPLRLGGCNSSQRLISATTSSQVLLPLR